MKLSETDFLKTREYFGGGKKNPHQIVNDPIKVDVPLIIVR